MGAQSAWMWTTASHEDEQGEAALVRGEDLSLHMPVCVCVHMCESLSHVQLFVTLWTV